MKKIFFIMLMMFISTFAAAKSLMFISNDSGSTQVISDESRQTSKADLINKNKRHGVVSVDSKNASKADLLIKNKRATPVLKEVEVLADSKKTMPIAPNVILPVTDKTEDKVGLEKKNLNPPSTSDGIKPEIIKPEPKKWRATTGKTLNVVVTEWAKSEGWSVRWDSSVNYPINVDFELTAETFVIAVEQLAEIYRAAETPILFEAYSLQKILNVSTK